MCNLFRQISTKTTLFIAQTRNVICGVCGKYLEQKPRYRRKRKLLANKNTLEHVLAATRITLLIPQARKL